MIDTSQDFSIDTNITNKLFITQLGSLQNAKLTNTINLLANNTFKHQIIFIDATILFINPISYSFTILTDLRYNNLKFKKLLIDLDIAT